MDVFFGPGVVILGKNDIIKNMDLKYLVSDSLSNFISYSFKKVQNKFTVNIMFGISVDTD